VPVGLPQAPLLPTQILPLPSPEAAYSWLTGVQEPVLLLLGKRSIVSAGLRHRGDQAMKRRPIILMATGWLLYVLSFFLPFFVLFRVHRGWEVAAVSVALVIHNTTPSDFLMSLTWFLFYWASNVLMLLTPLAISSYGARLRKSMPHLMLAVTVPYLALFIPLVDDVPYIKSGFFIWCASYVFATCGLYFNRRERLRTGQA
jgi:hypothetical protein